MAILDIYMGQIFTHHGEEIDRPRAGHGYPRRALGLAHRIGDIGGAVTRVKRHQDRADLGGGIHKKQPFGSIDHPESDILAVLDADADQAARDLIHFDIELGVAPALPGETKRFAFAVLTRRQCRQVAEFLFFEPLAHLMSIA